MSALSTPAFLVDEGGLLVFTTRPPGRCSAKASRRSATSGPSEWGSLFGPYDADGEAIPYEELPVVRAVRAGRPAHASFGVRTFDGQVHAVECSAFPILTAHGSQGAIAIFWPAEDASRPLPSPPRRAPRIRTGRRREGRPLGHARLGPLPRPGDDPLRRQHLLRRRHPLRRLAARPRRRHRDPQPRPGAAGRADPAPHPPHPPPPRPHPGPGLLRAAVPPADRDRDLGPGLARGQPARPDRPLHLGAALPGRGARAALRRLLPHLPGASGRSARPGSPPPRSPTAARRSATGSRTRGSLARLHPRPRAGARRRPRARSSRSGSPASPSPRAPTC